MKAEEVQSLLAYATNQDVDWWVQCPPSDYIFWFKSWDVKANIHSLDLFNQTPEKTANDVLAQLQKQNQFPSFLEPKDVTITISPDLTKFYESLKPAQEATQDMADKLGESYSELNDSMKKFSEKIKELGQKLAGINGNGSSKSAPAEAVMHNKDINQMVDYPCTCMSAGVHQANMRSIIMHLNDMHKWSREKIADWLDTLPSQPIYYPDLRTDEEKAADVQKPLSNAFDPTAKTKADFGPIKMNKGDHMLIYNSDYSLNSDQGVAQSKCIWQVTLQPYGGAGYVTVTSSTGTVTKYLPISTV